MTNYTRGKKNNIKKKFNRARMDASRAKKTLKKEKRGTKRQGETLRTL